MLYVQNMARNHQQINVVVILTEVVTFFLVIADYGSHKKSEDKITHGTGWGWGRGRLAPIYNDGTWSLDNPGGFPYENDRGARRTF